MDGTVVPKIRLRRSECQSRCQNSSLGRTYSFTFSQTDVAEIVKAFEDFGEVAEIDTTECCCTAVQVYIRPCFAGLIFSLLTGAILT